MLFKLFLATLTFTWGHPDPQTVQGYKLYQGTAPGVYSTPTDVGNVQTFQSSMTIDKPYYFAVTAYNKAGESDKSNEVVVYPKPVAPTLSIDLE